MPEPIKFGNRSFILRERFDFGVLFPLLKLRKAGSRTTGLGYFFARAKK